MSEYSQGVCNDGAAVLKDGEPMTIEQILSELREGQARAQDQGEAEPAADIGTQDREGFWAQPIDRYTHPAKPESAGVPEAGDE